MAIEVALDPAVGASTACAHWFGDAVRCWGQSQYLGLEVPQQDKAVYGDVEVPIPGDAAPVLPPG